MDLHDVQCALIAWKHKRHVIAIKRCRRVPVDEAFEAKLYVGWPNRHGLVDAAAGCGGAGVVVAEARADPQLKWVDPLER